VLTLPAFEWAAPESIDEAMALLAQHGGDALIIAGGTDAMPNLKHRLHEPRVVVHLGRLRDLHFVRDEGDGLHLGPRVTLSEIEAHPVIRRDFPLLARAAGMVAGPQLRNMGTLGGNLCLDTRCTYYNQSYPWREALGFCLKKDGVHCHVVPQGKRCVAAHSSDAAPALIALDAEVEIAGAEGRRVIRVEDFFVADGQHNNVLAPGELVTRVFLPARSRGMRSGYQKLRPRQAIDFPMLSVAFAAGAADPLDRARLVVSALAARPRVIGGVDALVAGQPLGEPLAVALAEAAHKQCRPQISIPYDPDYRHAMVPVFVKRAVMDAMNGGGA
jgi:4-hydroxybenzoyl-CoA reductase subunit beta